MRAAARLAVGALLGALLEEVVDARDVDALDLLRVGLDNDDGGGSDFLDGCDGNEFFSRGDRGGGDGGDEGEDGGDGEGGRAHGGGGG